MFVFVVGKVFPGYPLAAQVCSFWKVSEADLCEIKRCRNLLKELQDQKKDNLTLCFERCQAFKSILNLYKRDTRESFLYFLHLYILKKISKNYYFEIKIVLKRAVKELVADFGMQDQNKLDFLIVVRESVQDGDYLSVFSGLNSLWNQHHFEEGLRQNILSEMIRIGLNIEFPQNAFLKDWTDSLKASLLVNEHQNLKTLYLILVSSLTVSGDVESGCNFINKINTGERSLGWFVTDEPNPMLANLIGKIQSWLKGGLQRDALRADIKTGFDSLCETLALHREEALSQKFQYIDSFLKSA